MLLGDCFRWFFAQLSDIRDRSRLMGFGELSVKLTAQHREEDVEAELRITNSPLMVLVRAKHVLTGTYLTAADMMAFLTHVQEENGGYISTEADGWIQVGR